MNPAQADALRELLATQPVASLGTLHEGEPFVSMVPFAILPGGTGFVIHVSRLASHTDDILTSPQVSLMVIAPQRPEISPQALARMSIQGRAKPIDESVPEYAEARRAYLLRFPQSADMFGFADFSLFAILPRTIRFVGGFAQARNISPEALADILGSA